MTTEFDEGDVVAQVTQKLREKNPEMDPVRIEEIVREEVHLLAQRPVHDYVSVLSERAARKRLKHS